MNNTLGIAKDKSCWLKKEIFLLPTDHLQNTQLFHLSKKLIKLINSCTEFI